MKREEAEARTRSDRGPAAADALPSGLDLSAARAELASPRLLLPCRERGGLRAADQWESGPGPCGGGDGLREPD